MGIGPFSGELFAIPFSERYFFPIAYAIGSRWGVEGVCVAATLAYPVQFFVLERRCALSTEVGIGTFLEPLTRPFLEPSYHVCSACFGPRFLPPSRVGDTDYGISSCIGSRNLWIVLFNILPVNDRRIGCASARR